MVNLVLEIIKSVCMKCKLSSVIETLRKWGRLSDEQLASLLGKKRKTKIKLTKQILDLVNDKETQTGLSIDIVGDLELTYIQLHPTTKLWKVYKLTGGALNLTQDPRTLRSRLVRELQAKWAIGTVYGNISCSLGAVWLRLHLDMSNRRPRKNARVSEDYSAKNSVFLLHFQGSPFLIISQTRVKEMALLSQSLVQVFQAASLSYMQLSDRHVLALADIALKRKREIPVEQFKDVEGKENPLSRYDRKRKQDDDIFVDTDNMVDENKGEKRIRRMEVEKRFGSGPQPSLHKVEYKFTIGFHGQPVTEFDEECHNRVEVKGSSVLQGLCQLAKKGYMTFPLPKHVTGVINNQRNSFTIVSSSKSVTD